MALTLSSKSDPFIPIEDAPLFLSRIKQQDCYADAINRLVRMSLLPIFEHLGQKLVLKTDLLSYFPKNSRILFRSDQTLFDDNVLCYVFDQQGVRITFFDETVSNDLLFYPLIRNILDRLGKNDALPGEIKRVCFDKAEILAPEGFFQDLYAQQRSGIEFSYFEDSNQFARSASYMGSKRNLAGPLVEVLSSVLPRDGLVLDLMCGSGVVSGVFSQIWRTCSSDALAFPRILAKVRGGGFSRRRAEHLIEYIIPFAKENMKTALPLIGGYVATEDKIFHGDIDKHCLNEYKKLHETFPTFPSGKSVHGWDPGFQVERRRKDKRLAPYCLFTSYFANLFFGIRQAIEIDSLRFAIDQIPSEEDRDWALGALTSTVSALGTTYGGHFAQPLFGTPDDLTLEKFGQLIETRSRSIFHEFHVRLISLADRSEAAKNCIMTIEGPWEHALEQFSSYVNGYHNVLVYLDAPYTREEYSRYYHVLETLILYNYPSATGKGKIPDKKRGERFQSEFFTKTTAKYESVIQSIIKSILQKNWICAWSYSSNGLGNSVNIIREICSMAPVNVMSYSVPYKHRAQGGRGAKGKEVFEYVFLFQRGL